MKSFCKIFLSFFIFLAGCAPKTPAGQPIFLITWEWTAPRNAFIQNISRLNSHIFFALNTREIAFFPLAQPHKIQIQTFPIEGLVSILWTTNIAEQYHGIAWSTAWQTNTLTWFSISLPDATNTNITLSQHATLTYTQIYGLWREGDRLFWAGDGNIHHQAMSTLPENTQTTPLPYPYTILNAKLYENMLYLAQGEMGVSIIDLSENRATNHLWIIGSVKDVEIQKQEKQLFISDRVNGVRVYSLDNPWDPQFIDSYETIGNTMDIALTPEGVWLADHYNGISLLSFEQDTLTLRTNIEGRVISHIYHIPETNKLLLWHNDKLVLTRLSAP